MQYSDKEKGRKPSIEEIAFIVGIRTKLKLNQAEADHIFGVGPDAFSRYEIGETAPQRHLVILLKLLDRHPELFDEIK